MLMVRKGEDIMTKKKITYRCEACGEFVEIIDGEMNMPECCEMPMKEESVTEIEFCEKAIGPEFARLEDESGPCDDGTSGRIL